MAGRFESVLDVRGWDAFVEAVGRVQDSRRRVADLVGVDSAQRPRPGRRPPPFGSAGDEGEDPFLGMPSSSSRCSTRPSAG